MWVSWNVQIERQVKMTKIMYQEIHDIENAHVYGSPENIYGIVSFNIDNINPHDLANTG